MKKNYCIQNNWIIDEVNKALSSWNEKDIRNYIIKILNQRFSKLKKKIKNIIIAGKGYFKYNHYKKGLLDYKIILLIYPRSKIKLKKIYSQFNHKIEHLNENWKNNIYKRLLTKLKKILPKWKNYSNIRWEIEYFFNLMKEKEGYSKYHQYMHHSVSKNVFLVTY